jgi:mannosyl-3-phosphoglycerate phosphatase
MENLDLSLVVISDVDGCLLDGRRYSSDAASDALRVLRERDIPLVLCSSKTSRELHVLQQRLGLECPFICENGAAIYVPAGYFPFDIPGSVRRNGYEVLVFGGPHRDVVSAVRCAARETDVDLVLFADMSVSEIAEDTGLSPGEAVLAKEREHDEPFRLKAPESAARAQFELRLAAAGVCVVRGGRYDHAVMTADKGRATVILRHIFRKAYGPLTTLGLGDALNDVPFLRSVDLPVVVRSSSEALTREMHEMVPWALLTDAVGPAGWQAVVLEVVAGRVRIWEGPAGEEGCDRQRPSEAP